MRFLRLRIAFSATCLITCVLLIALWVRSYWYLDMVKGAWLGTRAFQVTSTTGEVVLTQFQLTKEVHFGWSHFAQSQVNDNFNSDPKTIYLNSVLDVLRLALQQPSKREEKQYRLEIETINHQIAANRAVYAQPILLAAHVGGTHLVRCFFYRESSCRALDMLGIQPPHSANRHDARNRGARADRVACGDLA